MSLTLKRVSSPAGIEPSAKPIKLPGLLWPPVNIWHKLENFRKRLFSRMSAVFHILQLFGKWVPIPSQRAPPIYMYMYLINIMLLEARC